METEKDKIEKENNRLPLAKHLSDAKKKQDQVNGENGNKQQMTQENNRNSKE